MASRALIREIAPSRAPEPPGFSFGSADGRQRGLAVHRMLQLATRQLAGAADVSGIVSRVGAELGLRRDTELLRESWHEVERLLQKKQLGWLFSPAPGSSAFNEVPIQYRRGQQTVYGIVDRLVVTETDVYLVDYKTHRLEGQAQVQQLADHYRMQLDLYREGVQRLWPDHTVKTYLLLTDGGKLVNIDDPPAAPAGITPR